MSIAKISYPTFVTQKIVAELGSLHIHQLLISAFNTRLGEIGSQKGEYILKQFFIGMPIMVYNPRNIDEMESGELEFLIYRSVAGLYCLVYFRMERTFDIKDRSDIDIQVCAWDG